MKKPTSILLFSLSILLISGCGRVVEESELNFRNGKYYPLNSDTPYSGKMVRYYQNGQLKAEGNFKKGEADGIYKSWYENGQLEHEINYTGGELNGFSESYYENGQLKSSGFYKDGKMKD